MNTLVVFWAAQQNKGAKQRGKTKETFGLKMVEHLGGVWCCAAINNCFALRSNKWGVCHSRGKVEQGLLLKFRTTIKPGFKEEEKCNCRNFCLTL